MNVTENVRKLVAASVVAMMVGFSSFAIGDEALQKTVEAIKVQLAEHTGVLAGFDRKHGVITLSGHTSDAAGLNAIIAEMKKIEGVKEVRNTVSRDN